MSAAYGPISASSASAGMAWVSAPAASTSPAATGAARPPSPRRAGMSIAAAITAADRPMSSSWKNVSLAMTSAFRCRPRGRLPPATPSSGRSGAVRRSPSSHPSAHSPAAYPATASHRATAIPARACAEKRNESSPVKAFPTSFDTVGGCSTPHCRDAAGMWPRSASSSPSAQ